MGICETKLFQETKEKEKIIRVKNYIAKHAFQGNNRCHKIWSSTSFPASGRNMEKRIIDAINLDNHSTETQNLLQ